MVTTRSKGRTPLAEVTEEHVRKRCKTLSITQTEAESPRCGQSGDGYDESRENLPPPDHILHICSPRTPKSGIYHTEWISSPFWRQSRSSDKVNRWETSADEIVLKIFSYLQFEDLLRCAVVCRHWRMLSYDRALWSRFNLSSRVIPFDRLLVTLGYGTRFLCLACGDVRAEADLPNPKGKKRKSVSRFTQQLQLEYVDFGLCNITTQQLTRLFDWSPNLRKVNLESLTISGIVLKALSRCPNLQVLNLAMCQNVGATQLIAVTRNCTKLEELNLAWCQISEKTFNHLFPKRVETMRKLNVSGGRGTVSCETIRLLTSNLPNLTSLNISDCFRINHVGLDHISEHCGDLEELSCSRVYELMAHHVLDWAGQMPKLARINSFPSILNDRFLEFSADLGKRFPHVVLNSRDTSDIARPCTELRLPKGSASLWDVKFR